ncbi:MAG: hypothetical protein JJU29_09410 [Verrucomicrobia bacterium]|nr:hypothetical protein [Verrucomicrobiota bacterium]MCH8514376.1 hypothetical protein [Kiritimatiellia bacterium]
MKILSLSISGCWSKSSFPIVCLIWLWVAVPLYGDPKVPPDPSHGEPCHLTVRFSFSTVYLAEKIDIAQQKPDKSKNQSLELYLYAGKVLSGPLEHPVLTGTDLSEDRKPNEHGFDELFTGELPPKLATLSQNDQALLFERILPAFRSLRIPEQAPDFEDHPEHIFISLRLEMQLQIASVTFPPFFPGEEDLPEALIELLGILRIHLPEVYDNLLDDLGIPKVSLPDENEPVLDEKR